MACQTRLVHLIGQPQPFPMSECHPRNLLASTDMRRNKKKHYYLKKKSLYVRVFLWGEGEGGDDKNH